MDTGETGRRILAAAGEFETPAREYVGLRARATRFHQGPAAWGCACFECQHAIMREALTAFVEGR